MQVFWTVLSGVSVFVLGQFVVHWIIAPLRKYREVRGEIVHALILLQNVNDHPDLRTPVTSNQAAHDYRSLAGQLMASILSIPLFGLMVFLHRLPSRDDILNACSGLIGLSNTTGYRNMDIRDTHRNKVINGLHLQRWVPD